MTPHLLSFAVEQWVREPEMRVEDAYKWLFQAALGGEHAVKDDSGPRAWLDGEWAGLDEPFAGESEITPLRSDGLLMRVNLRPYKASGGDKEALLQAFVASAKGFHADRRDFVREWNALGELLVGGPIGQISTEAWAELDPQVREAGYPAIEHSEAYLRSRRPAYRVMLADLWRCRQ